MKKQKSNLSKGVYTSIDAVDRFTNGLNDPKWRAKHGGKWGVFVKSEEKFVREGNGKRLAEVVNKLYRRHKECPFVAFIPKKEDFDLEFF